jgi:hypothetical protein
MTATARILGLALLLGGCTSGPRVEAPPAPAVDPCVAVTCPAHAACVPAGAQGACACDPGFVASGGGGCVASTAPALGGCTVFPADHLFNTPIDSFPAHPDSAMYLTTVGNHAIHLDLGTDVDPTSASYWGIPYNVVHGDSLAWAPVHFDAGWPDESDCAAAGATATVVSDCSAVTAPVLPIPPAPLVEGGIDLVDEDHHVLVVDADRCRLWEGYHATPRAGGGWDLLSSASWDLASNALRPAGLTSADAAGFPVLPLLLRASEAQSGTIRHALRFTLPNARIRDGYAWPARHRIGAVTSPTAPLMGQLFRLKASYVIPSGFSVQSKAILQAMKTYGMYLADAGSTWYVQGEPSAAWDPAIFSEVQTVRTADLEAVDLGSITIRSGFDVDSARVPPPCSRGPAPGRARPLAAASEGDRAEPTVGRRLR